MGETQPVAGVILGSGRGTRFGGPKAVARLGGARLVDRVAGIARVAGLQPLICVLPAGVDAPHGAIGLANPAPERGLSASLALGMGAVPRGAAAVILLVDQPTLDPRVVGDVVAARGRAALVAASAEGRFGPPVLVEPEAAPLLRGLAGDIGLRQILAAHPDQVTAVPVAHHPPDVDTAADLAALEARLGA